MFHFSQENARRVIFIRWSGFSGRDTGNLHKKRQMKRERKVKKNARLTRNVRESDTDLGTDTWKPLASKVHSRISLLECVRSMVTLCVLFLDAVKVEWTLFPSRWF